MICEHCGEEMIEVGYDAHHRVTLYHCGCCTPLPEGMMTTIRKCRIKGCDANHANNLFCCVIHWRMLPEDYKNEIWRTYQGGEGIFTAEYLQAAENAEAYLEDRDARDMSEVLS